ncbi:MAG: flagellar filament capping protein FliD [Clostridiaceae bacterium]
MAINGVNSTRSLLRLTGLGGSGLDTDTIVSQLMTAEKIPLNKLYQKKQLAEWKRDAYREITNKLRDLKDTYFNVAKSSSNLMSETSFKRFAGTTSNSAYVTVSGNAESVAGSHTVSVVRLATAGKAVSADGVTDALEGNAVSNFNLSGSKIQITLDGVTKELTLDNYSSTGSEIISKSGTGLQALVDNAFGTGKITVGYDEGTKKLSFDTNEGSHRITLSNGTSNNGLAALGFSTGASNRLDITKSLENLSSSFVNNLTFNSQGKLKFTINSKEFTFDKSISLSSMLNTINSDATAKVNIKYDETADGFVITAKQLGAGDNIIIGAGQEGNFFGAAGASGINIDPATMEDGKDAEAIIDGQRVIRSTNTFALNGATFTLVKPHAAPASESETVSLSMNTEEIYNNVKGFVDKYNEVISFINTKLTEKYDRDYQPLTDEQKEDLSEEEIKKWETTAKTGLLKGDSLLQNIAYNMRNALTDSIEGISTTLSSIGITTGEYSEKGKLLINETKLKAAIESDPNAVSELFTKESDISYTTATTSALRSQRFSNEGLASRISDILNDNIRTVGGKGLLLEKAGIQGDTTEFKNLIYKQIDDYDDDIDALIDKLNDKEDRYYAKFTALEKYISQMNTQSSWISQQFSNSSS